MTALQTTLSNKYGPGVYLTPSQLNWIGCPQFTPSKPAAILKTILKIDKLRPHMSAHRGDISISLGEINVRQPILPERYDGALTEDIIIKAPGEDVHYIPSQLESLVPVFQAFADFQYRHSPYATGKIGVARITMHPLKSGRLQQGNGWHRHTLSIAATYSPKHLADFEINDDDARIIATASTKLAATEGYWSNNCPTLLQRAFANSALNTVRTDTTHTIDGPIETPPFEFEQARPNELNVATSETFHTSAVPSASENGLRRVFLYIGYLHTKDTERAYLDSLEI